MQNSKEAHYSILLSDSELAYVALALRDRYEYLGGRPATDYIATKYKAVLDEIVRQKSETGAVGYY